MAGNSELAQPAAASVVVTQTDAAQTVRFWAIADTHLSFGKPKDMSRFSDKWIGHPETIAAAWRSLIASEDVVLIPGDVSWAQTTTKIAADLAWLAPLPGRKILLRGNHDHWWKEIFTVRKIIEPWGYYAIEGDSVELNGVIVCGAMGHIAPNDPYYMEDPRKDRYHRELKRLEQALQHANNRRTNGQPVILMMHYPPFTSEGKPTEYVDVITKYQPTMCIYGHLHRASEWEVACNGLHHGVLYKLVAADYLSMTPHLLPIVGTSLAENSTLGSTTQENPS